MSSTKERTLTQYHKSGNIFSPTGNVQQVLDPGVYTISLNPMSGSAVIEKTEIKSDSLLKLNNEKMVELFKEIEKFWESSQKFHDMGFTHKRGFVFHGVPGGGKSCFLKLVMEKMIERKDVCFIAKSAGSLSEVMKQFREVEPSRPVVVILEDFDEIVNYGGEHSLLELLDGPNSVGGAFYIATTNYLDRIPPRLIRKSRFDRVVEIGPPNEEDRYQYFKSKLNNKEPEEKIREYAKVTDGKVFSDLKDFLVATYCLDIPYEKVLSEMTTGGVTTWGSKLPERTFSRKFAESFGLLEPAHIVVTSPINEGSSTVAGKLLSELATVMPTSVLDANSPPSSEGIKKALEKRLAILGIDNVEVADVEVDNEGNIIVAFASNDNEVVVVFSYDDEEGAQAVVVGDGEQDDEESYSLVVDLDPLSPTVYGSAYGNYLNMFELGWLSKNTMLTILDAGEYETEDAPKKRTYDAFGNLIQDTPESLVDHELVLFKTTVDEVAYKQVIRGGKRQRLPILRRKKKKRLTPRQRAGIRKASRTRKSSASKRKRAKSLALRKRMKLKPKKTPRGFRVGG